MSTTRFRTTVTRADWIAAAVAVLLAVVVVLGVRLALAQIDLQLRRQTTESLRSVVATTWAGIALWREGIEAEIAVLAQSPELVAAVETLLEQSSRASAEQSTFARLQPPPSAIVHAYQSKGFAVVRPDGPWIARFPPNGLEDGQAVDHDLIEAALDGEITVRLSSAAGEQVQTMLVAVAPVRDRIHRIIAALVLYLDPMPGLTDMTRLGRPGTTGETYVFDRDGRILTSSRFRNPDGSPSGSSDSFDSRALSGALRSADPVRFERLVAGTSASQIRVNPEGYLDYRSVDVLGAWSWLPELDIGIAAEIDSSEALGPFRSIRTLTLSMLAVVGASFLALLAVLVSRGRAHARAAALLEAAQARSEILAMVSHDLRAPLHNVLLCSEVIAVDAGGRAASTAAASIKRSALGMSRLIADLSDVSEIKAGRLQIERRACEVRALLEDVRTTFAQDATARGIELEIDCPPDAGDIAADAGRLAQVLINLVGNAVKFTPAGGTVTVGATPLAAEVRFEVRDTGAGIAQDELPHVFERFWRATGSATKPGRGLGLYIAKKLVEAHGGRISVQRGDRTGTIFVFTIPR